MISSLIVSAIVFGLLFFSVAKSKSRPPPEYEKYEYSDNLGNRYSIVMRHGKISDSSFLYNPGDSLLEAMEWKGEGPASPKPSAQAGSTGTGADASGQRSTESILKVIRKNTPGLRKAFNRHLGRGSNGGKVILRFRIAPGGTINSLYLIGNTTGNQKFAMEVLREINSWKFEAIDPKAADDIVTIPFTFSE